MYSLTQEFLIFSIPRFPTKHELTAKILVCRMSLKPTDNTEETHKKKKKILRDVCSSLLKQTEK